MDTELVKQDLLNEFNTRQGERVMRPNHGSIIWDMLMEPEDPSTEEIIKEDIARIINKDSRVDLLGVTLFITDHTIRAEIAIKFNVLNSEDILYLNFIRDSEQDIT